jgi:hypothetical protein
MLTFLFMGYKLGIKKLRIIAKGAKKVEIETTKNTEDKNPF